LGIPITYLPTTEEGIIKPQVLENQINYNTSLVSIMLANNEVGSIQPIRELSDIAHSVGSLFHTDAVQAVGHIDVDVNELGVDFMSASAHKFNGPKGIGFLYIKNGVNIASFLHGGSQEFSLRAGTENVASIVGMAAALNNNYKKLSSNQSHILSLEKELLDTLAKLGIVEGQEYIINGSKDMHLPGNMSLSFKDNDGERILHRLDLMGIMVSTGAACNSINTQVSHVLNALSIPIDYAKGTIRISLGKNNTIDEAQKIAESISHILNV
ncbi:MAG: aminotransferase class V-fold PLP-dependent enzyme, partial [Bacilli bacterium]|nr:aminotransferase class V-fold PLP-dependent enzyme [Bacilli bacterium]